MSRSHLKAAVIEQKGKAYFGLISFFCLVFAMAFSSHTYAKIMPQPGEISKLAPKEKESVRPHHWEGPTNIYFLGFIIDIDEVDDTNQNFQANVFVRLRWQDPRLAIKKDIQRQIDIEDIWNPWVLITNQQGRMDKALPEVAQVSPDGTVIYRQRYTGRLSQPLDLTNFPLDKQKFTIQFAAAGHAVTDLNFIPDKAGPVVGGAIADELSLPDWKIDNFKAVVQPYVPIRDIEAAGFALQFEAHRFFAYYIWQVILPFTVVIIMAWSAFWIGRNELGIRIGVATSSVLTLIANRFLISTLLPELPYMTRMDYFTVGATLLVLFALMMVVLGSIVEKRVSANSGEAIDQGSRVAFPVLYASLVGWFLFF